MIENKSLRINRSNNPISRLNISCKRQLKSNLILRQRTRHPEGIVLDDYTMQKHPGCHFCMTFRIEIYKI